MLSHLRIVAAHRVLKAPEPVFPGADVEVTGRPPAHEK